MESPSMDTSGQLALPVNVGMDEHEYVDVIQSNEGIENALGNVLRLDQDHQGIKESDSSQQ